MKKLFTFLIIGILTICSLASCNDEAFDVDSVNKQTILVFYPWTGDANNPGLKYFLSNNIDSICNGIIARKGLNNTRVLVFFSEGYKKSTLYDLQYDATKRTVDKVPLKTYDGASYATAEGFADILNEVKQDAEALNYALIIGAHGCGWTNSSDWTYYPYYARKKMSSSDGMVTRFFGSVSNASTELAIDIPTLAEGIRQSGLKMQYILFDACYMGNVETAYELKDVTNFMLGSGSEILGDGVPYKSMWSYLNSATPNYTSFVSGLVNFYKNSYSPYCNMAAIDCRQLDKLASLMKEINSKYTLSSTVPLDSIQPLDGFSPHIFYDLAVYVDSLHPSGYLHDQFNSQLKLTVKAAAHTDMAYTDLRSGNSKYFKVNNYCGLTISDPSQHRVAIKGREKTGWWKATH